MVYLKNQIRAGVDAIQIFDSWVGSLSPADYSEYVLPHVQSVIDRLKPEGIPIIYFGTGTSTLLPLMRSAGSDVLGLDWHVELDEAWARVGFDVAVQTRPRGLFAPLPEIERRIKDILDRAGNRVGHIFNLGHGILPKTPVDHVEAAIGFVHKYSTR